MNYFSPDLLTILKAAVEGSLEPSSLKEIATSRDITVMQLLDVLAVAIAKGFDSREISFADADAAMNEVFALFITGAFRSEPDNVLPYYATSVFEAFDGGETQKDGEWVLTRPMISKILLEHQAGSTE